MTDEPSEAPAVVARTELTTADHIDLVAERIVPQTTWGAASIAHPHPQYGGSMHDAVVTTLWHALAAKRVAAVRFAFRGGGGSGGAPGGGQPERLDVDAAVGAAAALVPDGALLACGYSFGADVTLACTHPRLTAWMVVAPPLRLFEDDLFVAANDPRPTHLFVAAHDQYAPPDVVRQRTAHWAATTVHVVDMADHFFHGAHQRLATAFGAVLDEIAPQPPRK